jgi:hypothetical protein
MDALAAAHDAAVQMIDTSIVRVHQQAACITKNQHQWMGRSRGGLTSKIHALVDSNGLPVRLALSPGEAHDVSLPRPEPGRAVLQQDQAMSSDCNALRQACRAFVQLASIRLWLRVNESAP